MIVLSCETGTQCRAPRPVKERAMRVDRIRRAAPLRREGSDFSGPKLLNGRAPTLKTEVGQGVHLPRFCLRVVAPGSTGDDSRKVETRLFRTRPAGDAAPNKAPSFPIRRRPSWHLLWLGARGRKIAARPGSPLNVRSPEQFWGPDSPPWHRQCRPARQGRKNDARVDRLGKQQV